MDIWKDWTDRPWTKTATGVKTWTDDAYREFRLADKGIEVWTDGRWAPVARCQFRMQVAEAIRQLS
jgi:hypothetical protein